MSKKRKKKNSSKKRNNNPKTNKPKVENKTEESKVEAVKKEAAKQDKKPDKEEAKSPKVDDKTKESKNITPNKTKEVVPNKESTPNNKPVSDVNIEPSESKKQSGFKMYINSLKDDAKVEKENMKNMNSFKERFSYFMFYHKWHVLIAFIVLVALVYFVVNVVISKKPVYYCVVVNDSYNNEFKEELQTELNDVIEFNPSKEKVEIGTYSTDTSHYEPGYYGGDGGAQGIFSLMMDNLIDTMIAEPDEMEWFAMDNNFCNLKEILPSDLYEAIEPNIVMLKDSTGEAKPYAIDISNTDLYKNGKSNLKKPCIGIFSTTENLDESIETIKYIFDYVEQ